MCVCALFPRARSKPHPSTHLRTHRITHINDSVRTQVRSHTHMCKRTHTPSNSARTHIHKQSILIGKDKERKENIRRSHVQCSCLCSCQPPPPLPKESYKNRDSFAKETYIRRESLPHKNRGSFEKETHIFKESPENSALVCAHTYKYTHTHVPTHITHAVTHIPTLLVHTCTAHVLTSPLSLGMG